MLTLILFFTFTLYSVHSRVGIGNQKNSGYLMLVLNALRGMGYVIELIAAGCLVTRREKIKIK